MIRRIRQPKYRDRGRSFELLRTQWKAASADELWLLLRSITIREHLHTTGYFERNFATSRVVNSSYLLRRRRREIAQRLRNLGCEVSDMAHARRFPGVRTIDSESQLRNRRPAGVYVGEEHPASWNRFQERAGM